MDMKEGTWLKSIDLPRMLNNLSGTGKDRQLHLFAAACCRRIWHLLLDPRSQHAVEVLERWACRLATFEELASAAKAAQDAAANDDIAAVTVFNAVAFALPDAAKEDDFVADPDSLRRFFPSSDSSKADLVSEPAFVAHEVATSAIRAIGEELESAGDDEAADEVVYSEKSAAL